MPGLQPAGPALRALSELPSQQYVCRVCRAQALSSHHPRQFHASRVVAAESSFGFFKRLRDNVFGTKESRDVERRRDDAQQRQIKRAADEQQERGGMPRVFQAKGKEYEIAPVPNPSIDAGYLPASTWHKLERIGGEKWAKAKADKGEQYIGYVPKAKRDLTDTEWANLLHGIVVEVLALQAAGRDLGDLHRSRPFKSAFSRTQDIRIQQDGPSGAALEFGSGQDLGSFLDCIPVGARAAATTDAEPASEMEPSSQPPLTSQPESQKTMRKYLSTPRQEASSWMRTELKDASVKMAIMKRILQLTGRRISDPAVSNAKDARAFYDALRAKETPKKLAQTSQLKTLDEESANVVVYPTRRTPVHKDKEVGRWKVIEEELRKRELPVLGSRQRGQKVTLF